MFRELQYKNVNSITFFLCHMESQGTESDHLEEKYQKTKSGNQDTNSRENQYVEVGWKILKMPSILRLRRSREETVSE